MQTPNSEQFVTQKRANIQNPFQKRTNRESAIGSEWLIVVAVFTISIVGENMCGIFGLITNPESNFKQNDFEAVIKKLFVLSESRGKDASGLMLLTDSNITLLKRSLPASKIVKTKEFVTEVNRFSSHPRGLGETLGFMGHARMVTNGSEETHENNQPVLSHEMCMLHNGIIVNDAKLWSEFPNLKREYGVDTEIALNLLFHYRKSSSNIYDAFYSAFSHLQGANSIALIVADEDALILATSNGSLYFSVSSEYTEVIFASEKYILKEILQQPFVSPLFEGAEIIHVEPNIGYLFNFNKLQPNKIVLNQNNPSALPGIVTRRKPARTIRDIRPAQEIKLAVLPRFNQNDISKNDRFIRSVNDAVSNLRRCTRCILPETFPYIDFDEAGVCNYCREYKSPVFDGKDKLEKLVQPFRCNNGSPDCLVPISGGRDSCYSLHYIKKVLKLNPLAYTYDWGMVTDLARRNISRICGALGVEHILVSADIRAKRKNIRLNVLAWLNRPVLGTIPLFMAGDKQYFYHAYRIQRNYDLKVLFMGENYLEKTLFKTAFSGARQNTTGYMAYHASLLNQIRMIMYYMKEFALNPAYLNNSLLDTIGAFTSFYLIPHTYTNLFQYIPWDENEITKTIIDEYDWETAIDTQSTWRIGDGTASFYNYIYYVMTGFTENDTFRSNQIRERKLMRDDALNTACSENQPRYDAIQWYCDTIGIDLHDTISRINAAPKLY